MAKQLPKIKASTQEHLDVEDIVDDLVILKTGWVALILSSTAVNFDILSEAEQDATIYAYGALLNSLTFPIQVLIRSKHADITSYFKKISEAEAGQSNPDLKRQIQRYEDFLRSTVQQKTVLDKRFYLVLHYSPLEKPITGTSSSKAPDKKSQLVADAQIALAPKRDHLIKQFARLGLIAKQLTSQELIELFYDIYNPAPTGTQRVLLDSASYTAPLVQPAVEIPSPAPSQQDASQPSSHLPIPQPEQVPISPPQPVKLQTQHEALQKLQEAASLARQYAQNQTPTPAPNQTTIGQINQETQIK